MKKLFALVAASVVFSTAYAFESKVVAVHSPSMAKDVAVTLVFPDGYDAATEPFDVVYLLHGFGGDNNDWTQKGKVAPLADLYNLVFVCPDGGQSWYWDSPIDPTSRYETFVAKELVAWVDSNLKSNPDRSARAIVGLSMGGHGALYLALRHQDTFGAAGSTSGGVDIRPFNRWHVASKLGSKEEYPQHWEEYTVTNMLDLLPTDGSLALIVDCGVDDFFYEVNCELHAKLAARSIPHDFYVRPGKHNWLYWENSIKYQMLFFDNYFKSN